MRFLSSEKLSAHKYKTPEGYLICTDAILARTGKQTYRKNEVFADAQDDSEIEVDRRPEDVFSDETMASFENKPITVEHPNRDVNAENHNELSVGFARDIRRATIDGQDVMIGNLVITDAQTIEEIENGEHCELSCGYDCDIEDENNPVQKNIRGNHIALCERGRAGIARIVDSIKDNMTTKEFDYWSYHATLRPNDRNKLNRIIDLFYQNGYKLFDYDDEDFYDELSDAYANASSSLKNQINTIIKDSVKDSERRVYTFEYQEKKTGKTHSFRCTAPDAEEARNQLQEWAAEHDEEPYKILSTNMTYDSTAPADLERIPLEARKEMKEARDKKATLIGIAGQMQDIINRADKIEKDDLRAKAKKILSDLKAQFGIKEADFITVDSVKDVDTIICKDKKLSISEANEYQSQLNLLWKMYEEDVIDEKTYNKKVKDLKLKYEIYDSMTKDATRTKCENVLASRGFIPYKDKGNNVEVWKYRDQDEDEFRKQLLEIRFAFPHLVESSYREGKDNFIQVDYKWAINDSLKKFEIHDGNNITIVRAKNLADAIKKVTK